MPLLAVISWVSLGVAPLQPAAVSSPVPRQPAFKTWFLACYQTVQSACVVQMFRPPCVFCFFLSVFCSGFVGLSVVLSCFIILSICISFCTHSHLSSSLPACWSWFALTIKPVLINQSESVWCIWALTLSGFNRSRFVVFCVIRYLVWLWRKSAQDMLHKT